jgi:hypothetical protein
MLVPLLSAIAQHKTLSGKITQPMIDWALNCGLGPLLYASADQSRMSEEQFKQLKSSELQARFVADDQHRAMLELLDTCNHLHQPITLLKGISISTQFYVQPHLRLMSDIDILVDERDLEQVESALRQLGYEQTSRQQAEFYQDHHHSMPFYHAQKKIWFEVHHRLFAPRFPQANCSTFSTAVLDQEKQLGDYAGYPVYRFSTELQLVYIAAHWAFAYSMDGEVRAMVDVILLLQATATELDYDKLCGWLEDELLCSNLLGLLSYLERQSLIEIPAALRHCPALERPPVSKTSLLILHWIIDHHYVAPAEQSRWLTEHNTAIIWHTLMTTWRKPVIPRLIRSVLFPPNDPQRFKLRQLLRRAGSLVRGRTGDRS